MDARRQCHAPSVTKSLAIELGLRRESQASKQTHNQRYAKASRDRTRNRRSTAKPGCRASGCTLPPPPRGHPRRQDIASRKGGRYGWKPSSRSSFSIRAFRAYILIEIRQTVPCRAIRGNSISVNSTLPPLLTSLIRRGSFLLSYVRHEHTLGIL